MNRTVLTFAALLLTAMAYSQKIYQPTPKSGSVDIQLQADDTLLNNFFTGTPALYAAQSVIGGYASGNNGFGDKVKAQVYSIDNVCGVKGAIVWMGYKNFTSGNNSSKLTVNLYELDIINQVTGQGATALKLCPDSIYQSKTLNVADIDTASSFSGGANVVIFDTPQYFDTLFAVGIDFTGLAQGDTVACYTTTNGDADSTELAWEQNADSSWTTMLRNWNLDVDFAIFPIVDCSTTGIAEANTGFAFTTYPNPATNSVVIKTDDTKGQKQWVTIINASGKTVYNSQLTDNATTIAVDSFARGVYYILIRTADNKGYAKPIVIE